jgi:5-methylcytosine-specific restriction endonuclease McrBC GTP-binding regulatory subunit McrB
MKIYKLLDLVQKLESYIPQQALCNPKISEASIGWQIEHSLLTINRITDALKKSNPNDYRWSFRLSRLIIFITHKFPRGKAKAPKVVQPQMFDIESLMLHIKLSKQNIVELESLTKQKFFEHPYFGLLNKKKAIRFLYIHTLHHLKIIEDIVAGN